MKPRILAVLVGTDPPILSDREAALRLRPYGQGVRGAPQSPPVGKGPDDEWTSRGLTGDSTSSGTKD